MSITDLLVCREQSMESPRLQSVLQESMCYFYQSCSMSVEYFCVVLSICIFANFCESTLEVFCFVYFSFFEKCLYSCKFGDRFVINPHCQVPVYYY